MLCYPGTLEHLRGIFNSFREWKLTKGEIEIGAIRCLDSLAAVLEGMAGWRGNDGRR